MFEVGNEVITNMTVRIINSSAIVKRGSVGKVKSITKKSAQYQADDPPLILVKFEMGEVFMWPVQLNKV